MLGHGGRVEVQHTEALSRAMAATKTMVTLRKSMGKPWENEGFSSDNGKPWEKHGKMEVLLFGYAKITMENYHLTGKTHYKWPCSIAIMLNHQRVTTINCTGQVRNSSYPIW